MYFVIYKVFCGVTNRPYLQVVSMEVGTSTPNKDLEGQQTDTSMFHAIIN